MVCTRSGLSDLAFVPFCAAGYRLISHAVSPDTGEAVAKGAVKQRSFVLPLLRDQRERATSTAGNLQLMACCALALVAYVSTLHVLYKTRTEPKLTLFGAPFN